MASTSRPIPTNTKDLIDTTNRLSTQMAQRYMNIIRLAKLPPDPSASNDPANSSASTHPDRNEVAVNTLAMDIEVATLTTTAQELLSLTRRLKEMWLFGELRTLDQGKPLEQTAEDAAAVARMLAAMEREQSQQLGAAEGVSQASGNGDKKE